MESLQPSGPSRAAPSPLISHKYEEESIAHPGHALRTIAPSSFSLFQKQQDEEFYKVFPDARPNAQDDGQGWTWSTEPLLDTYTFSYNGVGAVKSWASPPTSSTPWSSAPASTESFSTVRSYSLEGALIPAAPVIDTAGSPPDSELSLVSSSLPSIPAYCLSN
ncbi:hypothetical protein CYLTODRAFT_199732 [Cylindrobasidium torrendii FP15055 ss-10]|uniref:Uncharacterized protein n=1 Tax=Cylindrobasidium torrendii FP15055 ss-10 TaxID=1314674 RepID=A0A0D7BKK0_9AGAR|nr:hypothetical protein CYLTODRAFT_199732 [Cylindrobasidium torrendii FP15055 ss-10]